MRRLRWAISVGGLSIATFVMGCGLISPSGPEASAVVTPLRTMKRRHLAGVVLGAVLVGCGNSQATQSPAASFASQNCATLAVLQTMQDEFPALVAALRDGDTSGVAILANRLLVAVMPIESRYTTDVDSSSGEVGRLTNAALGDAVTALSRIEASATGASSPGPGVFAAAIPSIAQASSEISAALRERDRLVSAGSLACPG